MFQIFARMKARIFIFIILNEDSSEKFSFQAEEAWKEREKQVQLMMMENREEIEWLWGELEESQRKFRESQRKLKEIEKVQSFTIQTY